MQSLITQKTALDIEMLSMEETSISSAQRIIELEKINTNSVTELKSIKLKYDSLSKRNKLTESELFRTNLNYQVLEDREIVLEKEKESLKRKLEEIKLKHLRTKNEKRMSDLHLDDYYELVLKYADMERRLKESEMLNKKQDRKFEIEMDVNSKIPALNSRACVV